jgi:hypothetical protein
MSMNAETILDRIMVKLGIAEPVAVELEQVKTEDGQAIFEADTFAVGEAVFIVTEDGKIPAPAGEFALEDGNIVEVDENGVIVEIAKKEAEVTEEEVMPEAVVEEVAAQNDIMKEQIEEAMSKPKKTVKTKTEMEESYFSAQIKELEAKFEARLSALEAEKVALSAVNAELEERLSSEPAPHTPFNPEATTTSKVHFHISDKREKTIKDRVFDQLFN